EQIAKHEADKAKLEAQKQELRGRLDAAVARLSELEQEMADRGGEEAKQLKEKLDGLRIERARATDGIETSKETLKQLRTENADGQLKELHSSTKESGKSLEKLQEDFHSRRSEETRLAKEQAELQTAILSLTRQYAQLKAEADVAENMKRGYTSAVSAILEC